MKKYLILLKRKDNYPMFRYIKIEIVCRRFEEALKEARQKKEGLLRGQGIEYEIDSITREW